MLNKTDFNFNYSSVNFDYVEDAAAELYEQMNALGADKVKEAEDYDILARAVICGNEETSQTLEVIISKVEGEVDLSLALVQYDDFENMECVDNYIFDEAACYFEGSNMLVQVLRLLKFNNIEYLD